MHQFFRMIAAAILVMCLAGAAGAIVLGVPPTTSFQGLASDASGHRLTGTVDLTFKYYDSLVGGTLYATEVQTGVPLTGGIFSVALGNGVIIPGTEATFYGIFLNHSAAYIDVTVKQGALSQTLTPRFQVLTSPYAFRAEDADSLGGLFSTQYLNSTSTPQSKAGPLSLSAALATPLLTVSQSGAGDGLDASAGTAVGMSGAHTATTGTAPGVQGTTASTAGNANAIVGEVTSTSPGGFSAGVRGQNDGTSGFGIGVYGSQAGSGWGVYGTTPSGLGVYGYSPSGIGIEGDSTSGTGIEATGASGLVATASAGIGVFGAHNSTTGTAAGVQGTTASTDASAYAVLGELTATTAGGFSAAVRGKNDGTGGGGIGVYGSHNGSGWGVYATSVSGVGVVASGGSGVGVAASGTDGVEASASTGTGVSGSSSTGVGVLGQHAATTGTVPGVEGQTFSTADDANAIFGEVTSTSPGGFSSAVRGQNDGTGGLGIGVYGSHAGGGWGVYATSVSGVAVEAGGGTGTGVEAYGSVVGVRGTTSGAGIGVVASANGVASTAALEINNGALRVSGNTPTAFVWTSTATNVTGDWTTITNPLTDGDTNAMIIVTHVYEGNRFPTGAYYVGGHWAIYREDGLAMPPGEKFNVLVIKQ